MSRINKVFGSLLLLVMLPGGALMAQGEAGADCLIIPPSARANAMGQSYVAVAEDATGIWWNPGGLAFVNVAVDLMHSQLVPDLASDVFYEYLGGVYQIEGIGTVGAALIYLTYGEWEHTKLGPEPLGTYSSWEIAPTLSGSVKLWNSLGLGMNLKFVYISLAPAEATIENVEGKGHSVAVDFGGLWKVPDFGIFGFNVSHLNLGLAVTNLGPSITFVNRDQAASLPRTLRLGFSWYPVYGDVAKWALVGDFNRPLVEFERSNTYHFGSEFVYASLIAVRAGYVYDKDGNIKDPTYGLGFIFNNKVRIDWASIPQAQELGRVHRWSVGVTF
jgi:hypothetical protein